MAPIRYQKWKDHVQIMREKYFHDDDVTDDVTAWRQSQPSIFMFKQN